MQGAGMKGAGMQGAGMQGAGMHGNLLARTESFWSVRRTAALFQSNLAPCGGRRGQATRLRGKQHGEEIGTERHRRRSRTQRGQ